MAVTIVFPEFILAKALCELKEAIDDTLALEKQSSEIGLKVDISRFSKLLNRVFHLFDIEKRSVSVVDDASIPIRPGNLPILGDNDEVGSVEMVNKTTVELPKNTIVETHVLSSATEANNAGRHIEAILEQQQNDTQTENPNPQDHDESSQQDQDNLATMEDEAITRSGASATRWTLTHSYFTNMVDILIPISFYTLPVRTCSMIKLLPRYLRSADLPSKEEIEDKSKADVLVKSLAVISVSQLIISIFVRRALGLSISQLEITTVAFSVMAFMTYVANLQKPKDVGVALQLSLM